MSISSDGILVFGIDLGEELPEQWQEYEGFDFEKWLADEAGLPPWRNDFTDEESSDHWAKKREIVANCPVSLEWYCSYDYPMYILAIQGTRLRACRGDAIEFERGNTVVSEEKINAAKEWCEKYNIPWSDPKWLLCSMYG